jgi:hypothetical protein
MKQKKKTNEQKGIIEKKNNKTSKNLFDSDLRRERISRVTQGGKGIEKQKNRKM